MRLKCCGKYKNGKFSDSVSLLDMFGLTILLAFYLFAICAISIVVGSLFYSIFMAFFEFGQFRFLLEFGVEFALFIVFLIKSLGKFLHACSYLLNYRLTIRQRCSVCGSANTLLDVPKNADPF